MMIENLPLNEFYNINFTYYKNVKLYLIENSNPTVCICKIYLFIIHISVASRNNDLTPFYVFS